MGIKMQPRPLITGRYKYGSGIQYEKYRAQAVFGALSGRKVRNDRGTINVA
jgi:hypothetical protein